MAIKILQIDLQNDITPQIGSYDSGVTPNNWHSEDGVYSLGPNNNSRAPYYWFTPTQEVTDFDLCWEDYQDHSTSSQQFHLEIGDSAGNVVLSIFREQSYYNFGPAYFEDLAYQTWRKMLVEVRKASATTSKITVYVNGKKVATRTSDKLITSAKIALLGHVPYLFYDQDAGQRLRYVTIYDRSYASKGINLDGMMAIITGFVNKLKGSLSTVAFSGSYNDLSNKPTLSTVNNGTLTIQQNGTNVQTFTANASTNKTANIQCVDLSTAQTISGVKSFKDTIIRNVGNFTAGEAPTAQTTCLVLKHTNNDSTQNANSILSYMFTSGESMCELTQNPCIGSIARTWFRTNTDGSYSIYSYTKNGALGIPGYKWKDVQTEKINSLNPGALSLPSTNLINIASSITVLDGTTQNKFTPQVNGWLLINGTGTANEGYIYVVQGRIGMMSANNTTMLRCAVLIPVVAGLEVSVTCKLNTLTWANIASCQGNV